MVSTSGEAFAWGSVGRQPRPLAHRTAPDTASRPRLAASKQPDCSCRPTLSARVGCRRTSAGRWAVWRARWRGRGGRRRRQARPDG
eukprot:4415660-Prymnesium_polylepis.1